MAAVCRMRHCLIRKITKNWDNMMMVAYGSHMLQVMWKFINGSKISWAEQHNERKKKFSSGKNRFEVEWKPLRLP